MEKYLNLIILICILILITGIVTLAIYLIYKLITKRDIDYVIKNSIVLHKLMQINDTYSFYDIENYRDSFVYDNNDFFEDISCEDFLIYQLRDKEYEIKKELGKLEYNKQKYIKYIDEIERMEGFGASLTFKSKLKTKRLKTLEIKLFEKNKLNPIINFAIIIRLYYCNMAGYMQQYKKETFYEDEIKELLQRLNDKNRGFYNDRDIWESLCKVERGKVTNKIRFEIYKRDSYRCQICGRSESECGHLEIDHIKPISKGGKSTLDNLQTLCKTCNENKGNMY